MDWLKWMQIRIFMDVYEDIYGCLCLMSRFRANFFISHYFKKQKSYALEQLEIKTFGLGSRTRDVYS